MRPSPRSDSLPCRRWWSDGRAERSHHHGGPDGACQGRFQRARIDRGSSLGHGAAARPQRLHHGDAGQGTGHGGGLRRAPARGQGGVARRHSVGNQRPVLHRGRADHRRLPYPGRIQTALRIDRDGSAMAGRRCDAGQAQHGRIRHGLVQHHQLPRFREEPLEAPGRKSRSGAGRLFRRFGRCGGGAGGHGGDGHRYRRLDPSAGGLLRPRRVEAHLWALLALGHRGLCLLPRSGGTGCPHGGGRGLDASGHGRPRPEGFDGRGSAGAGLSRDVGRRRKRPQDRHSQGIPRRRHGWRDR